MSVVFYCSRHGLMVLRLEALNHIRGYTLTGRIVKLAQNPHSVSRIFRQTERMIGMDGDMMPPKKTRSKRAGDPAHGAGEKNGKKQRSSLAPHNKISHVDVF